MAGDKLQKIDFHTHILPRKIPKWREAFGYGNFIELVDTDKGTVNMMKNGEFFREVSPNTFDLDERLKDMRRDGVDVQVLCTVPVMFSYWAQPEHGREVSEFLNDDLYQSIQRYPKHFIGLGTVPMQSPKLACSEMKRCVEELGFPGIQIGSHIEDKNLDDAVFEDFWAEAARLQCVVFIHPWDMQMGGRHTKYWLPWLAGMPYETCHAVMCVLMGGVLERHPTLKIVFAHGAGSFPFTVGRIEHGYNCRPDLCATDCDKNPAAYVGKFYCDSITHNPDATDFLAKVMGEDKIVFGTDYPFPLGEVTGSAKGIYPGHALDNSSLSADAKRRIYVDNCLDVLGLSREAFES